MNGFMNTRRVHPMYFWKSLFKKCIQESHSRQIFECERSPLESSTNAAGKPLLPARYVRALSYSRPRYETKTKKNPILHCHDEGVIAKVPSPLYRRRERIASSETTRMASESEAIGPLTRELAHCSLVRDASHPEADPIGCVITGVSRYEIRFRRARQTIALLLDTKDDGTEEMRQERGDCEASRRWSALDLASVRSLAGPSCSPVLICFLLPLRHHPSSSPRDGPFLDHPLPPRSRKRGFRSPPVLAAASCCRRCCETPERRRRMRTLLITLVVLYAPEEKTPSLCRYCPPA